MKKYLVLLVLIISITMVSFSQVQTISFLKIEGNTSLATSIITSKLSNAVKIGQPLNTNALYQALQSLYETGYFSYIEPKIEYSPIGPGLVIVVVENPVIKSVDVSVNGPDLVSIDKIKDAITVKASEVLNLVSLKNSFQNIMNLYTSAGYLANIIGIQTNIVQSGNSIIVPDGKLKITVNEYAVWDLKLTGDYGSLTSEDIIKATGLFTMKEYENMNPIQKLFANPNDAYLKISTVQDFQAKLFQMGYFSMDTTLNFSTPTNVASSFKSPAVDLVVNAKLAHVIQSGMPVDGYYFTGVTEVNPSNLARYAGITAPSTTNNFLQLYQLAKIREYYQNHGYLLTSAEVIYHKFQSMSGGFLEYKIIERHIGQIEITGNTKTKTYLIKRELAFKVGDPLTTQSLIQSYNNLRNTQFFSNVSIVPTLPSTDSTIVNIVVQVVENDKPRQIGASLSVSQPGQGQPWYSGITGSGNISIVNLNGIGDTLSGQVTLGVNPTANVTYGIIFPLNLPMNFTSSIYYNTLQPFVLENGQTLYYNETEYGISASVGYQPDVYTSYNIGGNFYFFNKSQGSTPISASLMGAASGTCRSVSLSYNYTNVNNVLLTTQGIKLGGNISYAGFGGQENYLQGYLSLSGYLPIFNNFAIAGRILIGDGYGQDFYVGGPTTVRGWSQEGGLQEFVSNLELRYVVNSQDVPIMLTAFYDFGGAGDQLMTYGMINNQFMNSIGVGINFEIPYLGVLRFDFPYKVVNGNLQYSGISFGVGEMF
ncbi:BamA/OMP85 family outer membrane protein [Athalassotoga saccharophila]|uniref:BamA/OMP85 family outer membrane protein n=1 Tax=Athalassotoga saccharophila TaxID=1441386 RepID=UPI00137A900A|nr:POTRA domain-containing protein [Athalassotoga saccharophila]BBJ28052.1 outer membrane protein assembly factor BamA [Athalassotoga saccharophila]